VPNVDIDGDGRRDPDIVITGRKPRRRFFFITPLIRRIGHGLDRVAEWIEPPDGRQAGESFERCMARVGNAALGLGTAGIFSMGAGGALLPYSRGTFEGKGSGTSVTSSAARGAFGDAKFANRHLGTRSIGGAVGRALSGAQVAGGAAAAGFAAGQLTGAARICSK
jgi:hypothetical protein